MSRGIGSGKHRSQGEGAGAGDGEVWSGRVSVHAVNRGGVRQGVMGRTWVRRARAVGCSGLLCFWADGILKVPRLFLNPPFYDVFHLAYSHIIWLHVTAGLLYGH